MSDARGGNQVFLMVYVYFRLIGSFTFLSPHIVHVEVNAKFANFSVIIDVGMVLWHRMCSLAYSRENLRRMEKIEPPPLKMLIRAFPLGNDLKAFLLL